MNQIKRSLDEYIEAFRLVVEASWDHVAFGDPYPEYASMGLSGAVGDWLQVQWECLVEGNLKWTSQLDGYLVWYAEGIDDGMSMRYSEPDALMTHEVCFLPREGTTLIDTLSRKEIRFPERGLPFAEFVSLGDPTWAYARRPPLDFVLARDLPEELESYVALAFAREEVRFVLRKVEA